MNLNGQELEIDMVRNYRIYRIMQKDFVCLQETPNFLGEKSLEIRGHKIDREFMDIVKKKKGCNSSQAVMTFQFKPILK